jgi:hypothetical protein
VDNLYTVRRSTRLGRIDQPESRNEQQMLTSALKMEAVCFSESFVFTYISTQHYHREDQHRHLHRRENLKSDPYRSVQSCQTATPRGQFIGLVYVLRGSIQAYNCLNSHLRICLLLFLIRFSKKVASYTGCPKKVYYNINML